ncbi:hypothetical protein D3C72_1721130 [compost metagenome]
MLQRQCLEGVAIVELGGIARALHQHDLARVAARQQVEDHRARARQPRSARHEHQRPRVALAHEKAAQRARQLQALARLQLFVHIGGGAAAGHQADVQFDLVRARRAGDGERTR